MSSLCAGVAQLARAPVCGTGGHGFEPHSRYHSSPPLVFMDVEKTIEFLIQNQAAHDDRLTRLENAVGVLADKTNHLDDVMVTLAESMGMIAQQSAERDRRLGERIESLVSAIGEFIRSRPTTA